MPIFVAFIFAMFIGEHIAKLDDKGRLVFPSPLKAQAEREGKGGLCFVVKKNLFRNYLEMFTNEEWEQKTLSIRSKLNIEFNREHEAFWSAYMSDCAQVEPDEKMGRILIPKRLLDKIGVNKEVVFFGSVFKIEVWAKERYREVEMSESDYVTLAQKLLG